MGEHPPFDPDAVAAELAEAERIRRGVALLTERWPDLTFADARRVARARDALRRAAGDQQVGYKLGWTSDAMREALGIRQPNWGTVWRSQAIADGATLEVAALLHPKVEPEIVYRAGVDLAGPDVTPRRVIETAAGWSLGLEIVDPRFPDYGFRWLDNTADNSSAGRFVVSAEIPHLDDPARVEVVFDDGETTLTGAGERAMGSPAAAVAWLVAALHAEGTGLAAGEIVLTGGLTAPLDVVPGRRYRLRAPGSGLAVTVEAI
ncbi:MAG: hypothetical protein D6683_00425 [Actinomyces sp.]|nr:MAG: hypothetical protein D6683_00425 [Actinomyces sp.]